MELYHVLNRGVDKRDIFLDDQDRARFVHDMFEFNDTAMTTHHHHHHFQMGDVRRPPFGEQGRERRKLLVYVHAFCLMPNHYHLLLSPAVENGISLFMKKLNGGYAKYFNERYERSGTLFQGKYKSVHIQNDAHFLYIPFYIHFNPLDLSHPKWRSSSISRPKQACEALLSYRWSSHLDYLGKKNFPSVTQRDFLSGTLGTPKQYEKRVNKMLGTNFETQLAGTLLE